LPDLQYHSTDSEASRVSLRFHASVGQFNCFISTRGMADSLRDRRVAGAADAGVMDINDGCVVAAPVRATETDLACLASRLARSASDRF